MMWKKKVSSAMLLGALVSGCTWVELSEEGADIDVLTPDQASDCRVTGETTVSVADRVGLPRSSEKVESELEILARNWAAERGGDAIMPSAGVKEGGERDYLIYRCQGSSE